MYSLVRVGIYSTPIDMYFVLLEELKSNILFFVDMHVGFLTKQMDQKTHPSIVYMVAT